MKSTPRKKKLTKANNPAQLPQLPTHSVLFLRFEEYLF
jgi:hypothetical protein